MRRETSPMILRHVCTDRRQILLIAELSLKLDYEFETKIESPFLRCAHRLRESTASQPSF